MSSPVNIKDNTTSVEKGSTVNNFKVSKFMKRNTGFKMKEPQLQLSNTEYVPYSIKDVEKNIRYYSSTCGYYEYACVLKVYLQYLLRYKSGHLQKPPKYPDLCQYQPEQGKYKRPSRYQNVSIVSYSKSYYNTNYSLSEDTSKYIKNKNDKEKTLMHHVPDEITKMIL